MIKVKVIADSITKGKRITTLQLTLPRFILAQLNTHRVFSRNSSSSRAVPVHKIIDEVFSYPVIPIHWGQNQKGMVAENEVDEDVRIKAEGLWKEAAQSAVKYAQSLSELGIHKQVVNRILEPFMWTKTLVTSTEWENFFNLRLPEDAQPEIQMLAHKMKEALDNSTPVHSWFHLPYLSKDDLKECGLPNPTPETRKKLLYYWPMISAARCARVSYLNHDELAPDPLEDMKLAEKLLEHHHMSPFEHQAFSPDFALREVDGVFKRGSSRNFKVWIQNRSFFD